MNSFSYFFPLFCHKLHLLLVTYSSSLSPLPKYSLYDSITNLAFHPSPCGGDTCCLGYFSFYFVDTQEASQWEWDTRDFECWFFHYCTFFNIKTFAFLFDESSVIFSFRTFTYVLKFYPCYTGIYSTRLWIQWLK